MEFKGTKGSWSYQSNSIQGMDESYYILVDEKNGWGKWIAEAKYSRLFNAPKEEALANATLISAAPDLLDALQDLVDLKDRKDHIGKDEFYIEKQKEAWIKAKAVIKKALTIK